MARGDFEERRGLPLWSIGTFGGHLCKNGWTDPDAVCAVDSSGPKEACVRWGTDPPTKGQLLPERTCLVCPTTLCHELCKNGWTDRFVVWIVDSDGPKVGQVQSYSPDGANVPGEYDWNVRMRRRCYLTSNYFDHLLLLRGHRKQNRILKRQRRLKDDSQRDCVDFRMFPIAKDRSS